MSLPMCTFKCPWMGNVCLNVFYLESPWLFLPFLCLLLKHFDCIGITFPRAMRQDWPALRIAAWIASFASSFVSNIRPTARSCMGLSGEARRVWRRWADGWGRAFHETLLGTRRGSGEGIGGERLNSMSSMGLGRIGLLWRSSVTAIYSGSRNL